MNVRIKTARKKDLRCFTKDQEYKVLKSTKKAFFVKNDKGMKCICLWKNCNHIKGDWEIVKEDGGMVNWMDDINVESLV